MTKTEHLQFLVLMIPTVLILVAAAVSMADLGVPEREETYTASVAVESMLPVVPLWDERLPE
jgi:hypothetical protein